MFGLLAAVFDTIPYLTQLVDEVYIIFAEWRLKNIHSEKPFVWEVEKRLDGGGGTGSALLGVESGGETTPPIGPGASCRTANTTVGGHGGAAPPKSTKKL